MTVDELRRKSNMGLRELRELEEGTAKDGKDKLFVLLKEPTDITEFGATNDYGNSVLRKKVNEWFKKYEAAAYDYLIYPREVSLLTMDGRENYGIVYRLAAPLTFDEWRKYSRYIPDCEKSYWLATGDGATGRYGVDAAMLVYPNGAWSSGGCSNAYAVRPALVVSEELIDTPKDDGLSKYSTMELIQELEKRVMRDERVLQE